MSLFDRPSRPRVFAKTEVKENCKVKAGLAYSPSMVMELTNQGIAVSSSNAEAMFFDGVDNPSYDIPADQVRGADIVSAWEASRTARANLINAHRKDKRRYG